MQRRLEQTTDPRAVLVTTIAASAMAFIDGSLVQIALPAIQADLSADFATLQWVVGLYNLFLGALVLVGGALGDSLGRRRVFLVGTVVFTVASLACGLAWSATALVAARGLQGIGAALMVPQSLALIAAAYPEETRGRAIGTWAAASALTTAAGPLAGGLLIDWLSWRAAFLVNIPIGLAVVALAVARVPESRAEPPRPADAPAGLVATAGLGGLTYALIHLPDLGWTHPAVIAGLLAAVVAVPAFLWREARTPFPMVPLPLFHDWTFSALNLMTVLLYGALGGALFLAPYCLIGLHGYSAAESGAATLPLALSIGLLSRPLGALGDRLGPRIPLALGSFIVAAALAWLALTGGGGSYWTGVFGPVLGVGLGMALVISPLTTAVMNAVGEDLSGTASGISNAAARVAGLLAVAVSGAILVSVHTAALGTTIPAAGVPADVGARLLGDAARLLDARPPEGASEAVTTAVRAAVDGAFLSAFRWTLLLNATLAALAGVVSLTLGRRKTTAGRQI